MGRRILKFLAGLGLLIVCIWSASRDWTWSGSAGNVLHHNLVQHRDATGLFYTEVEQYWTLQRALDARRQQYSSPTLPTKRR